MKTTEKISETTETRDQKTAEFPTKYGTIGKGANPEKVPPTPILGLAAGMTETTIQLRFAGYKDSQHKEAQKALNDASYEIGKLIRVANESQRQKREKAADFRQRGLNDAEKVYQELLRAARSSRDTMVATIERHHTTAITTARQTFEKEAAPLNSEMERKTVQIRTDLEATLKAALAEMNPAMEVAKAARLTAEAERKAKAAALVEAAKSEASTDAGSSALAGATDEELAAAAAVEAKTDEAAAGA